MKRLLFLFLFVPFYALSQEKDISAQVIFHKGFIEKGYVRYTPWINNPWAMIYTGEDKVVELLLPEDVKQITIEGKDIYIGANVLRYNNPIETRDINYFQEEPTVTEPVFLRLLTTGPRLSLYIYKDAQKTHYFIRDSSEKITTLRYVRFFSDDQGSISLQEKTYFRDQLKPYIQEGDIKSAKFLSNLRWREDEMIRIIKMINKDNQISYADKEMEDNRRQQRLLLGAAPVFTSVSLQNAFGNLGKMNFESKINPMIYAGYRFTGIRKAERFSIQLMASYFGYNMTGIYDGPGRDGTEIQEQLNIQTKYLNISFELFYAFVKKEQFAWEFGPGFLFVYPFSVSTNRTTNEVNIYGQPMYVEPFPDPQSPRINFSIVNQFHLGNHSIRFVYSPFQKMTDMGVIKLSDRFISLGYHYNFKL